MPKKTYKNDTIFHNLPFLKTSYKLDSPERGSWVALGNKLKIQHVEPVQPSYQQTWSEEISSNPFVKTKQLFKNKNSRQSFIQDDFTNQYLFTNKQIQIVQNIGNNFQFDSFGIQEVDKEKVNLQQYPSNNLSGEGIKGWNSQSMEINFQKVRKDELILPELPEKAHQESNIFYLTKIQKNDSSIHQFCFRLTESSQTEVHSTPIKRWADIKKAKSQLKKCGIQQQSQKKQMLRKIISDFLNRLQDFPKEKITFEFIQQAKNLLEGLGSTDRKALHDRTQESINSCKRLKTNQDSSSTLRLFTDTADKSEGKTQRRIKTRTDMPQFRYSKHFKIYQCNSKTKQNKATTKSAKNKMDSKQGRFKF